MSINHAFINVKGKVNFVPEIDIAFDLSNTLKQTSKIYSEWSWLATDLTLPFFSNNVIIK